jgi:hypothetical protein
MHMHLSFFFHVGFSCSQSFQILVCSTMLIHPFSCLSYILFGTLYSARWSVELLLRTFFHDVSKRRILSCMYHPIQSKSLNWWEKSEQFTYTSTKKN